MFFFITTIVLLTFYHVIPVKNNTAVDHQVVCSSCFKMLEVIDEVQLTQTKNKADIRRKFQQTVSSKGLSYARGEKVGQNISLIKSNKNSNFSLQNILSSFLLSA